MTLSSFIHAISPHYRFVSYFASSVSFQKLVMNFPGSLNMSFEESPSHGIHSKP